MHPALRLENIANLPTVSLRRSATLAAKGSLAHLRKLYHLIISDSSPQFVHFLPAIYCNLDPANIPSIPELDEQFQLPHVKDAITRAGLALDSLYFLDERGVTPQEVHPIMWPRVWQWSWFLDTYPHCNTHPDACGTPERQVEVSLHFFYHMGLLHRHADTARLMDMTPGLRVFVVKSWGLFLERGPPHGPAFEDLARFIGRREATSDPEHIEEFIEGAGGTASNLGFLVVKHITSTSTNLGPDTSRNQLLLIDCVVRFVVTRKFDPRYIDFYRATVSHGIIPAIIRVVNSLEAVDGVGNLLESCFCLLDWTMYVSDPHRWITEALEAGLLRAIISCATYHGISTPATRERLHKLLTTVLPQSLIYHSVLSIIKGVFKTVEDLVHTKRFLRSQIIAEWDAFKDLLQKRLRVLNWFNSPEFEPDRDCDNMAKLDWKQGDHRDSCARRRKLRLTETETLTRRDRLFLRALIDHDYTAARESIFYQQISFMRANPSAQFYVLFDYSEGDVAIEVKYSSDCPAYMEGIWVDYMAREADSGGRMELHLIKVGKRAAWVVPMRSDSSRINEGLGRIAASVELGEIDGLELEECSDELREEVEILADEQEEEVTYIH
ncbi:hypothetical protein FB451DRAFT_1509087 [Mycena latifolia]|nr:hypothetical protein FB451DRAFT_1509087 [Mycena latifolia]